MQTTCKPTAGSAARQTLERIAAAGQQTINAAQVSAGQVAITYPDQQRGYEVFWRGRGVPPPPCTPPFTEAIPYLVGGEPAVSVRRDRAFGLMSGYFEMGAGGLRLPDGDAKTIRTKLHVQHGAFVQALGDLGARRTGFSAYCQSMFAITEQLAGIIDALQDLDPSMPGLPCMVYAAEQSSAVLATLRAATGIVSRSGAVEVVRSTRNAAAAVFDILRTIVGGYAIVTENASIAEFYLLRLLVGYRLDPDHAQDRATATVASGVLTRLLNQDQPWLAAIMQRMVATLAAAVTAVSPANVVFFLKGGRGLNALLQTPDKGENDWDTQVLINPGLGFDEWGRLYAQVRDVVTDLLMQFNFIFSANFMAYFDDVDRDVTKFQISITADSKIAEDIVRGYFDVVWQDVIDDQVVSESVERTFDKVWADGARLHTGNCKAELIDVGIPRYYTVELLDQWRRVRGTVAAVNGIPYPGIGYFVDESITMIRECDAGLSASPAKRAKRTERLISLLSDQVAGFTALLAEAGAHIAAANLVACPREIATIMVGPAGPLATILLAQFCTAYRLDADPGLAGAFDVLAAAALQAQAVAGAQSWDGQLDRVFQWCAEVSAAMQAHLDARSDLIWAQAGAVASLVDGVVKGIAERTTGVAEASFAAHWLTASGQAAGLRSRLDPVEFAAVSVVYTDCVGFQDGAAAKVAAVLALVQAVIARGGSPFGNAAVAPGRPAVMVFLAQPMRLGTVDYAPLAVEFALCPAATLDVAVVRGLTVRALPPLIAGYRDRAAAVSELVTRTRLVQAMGALITTAMQPRARL